MTYLNHAGTSWPKPEPVRAAAAEALAAAPESWSASFDAAHASVARTFGIVDPGRLLLTPGCTSALAAAVADLPWEPGDRALASGHEHHALHRPLSALAHRGVELVVAPPSTESPIALEVVERELRRGRVRLVACTAASNVTGELLPVRALARLAHEHGALCLVDAAQVAGWLALDVALLEVDLLAFAGHKGPQAPWGIGGLWVAPHVAMATPAASCAVGAGPRSDSERPCAPMPGYCDTGSVDRAALAGLAAGLAWLAEPERADRLARARALVARLADGAHELPGVTLHGPVDPAARMPTLALTVAGRAPAELAARLAERDVIAAGGLQCAPLAHETLGTAPDGVLRFSAGPTSTEADVEHALGALQAVR